MTILRILALISPCYYLKNIIDFQTLLLPKHLLLSVVHVDISTNLGPKITWCRFTDLTGPIGKPYKTEVIRSFRTNLAWV